MVESIRLRIFDKQDLIIRKSNYEVAIYKYKALEWLSYML